MSDIVDVVVALAPVLDRSLVYTTIPLISAWTLSSNLLNETWTQRPAPLISPTSLRRLCDKLMNGRDSWVRLLSGVAIYRLVSSSLNVMGGPRNVNGEQEAIALADLLKMFGASLAEVVGVKDQASIDDLVNSEVVSIICKVYIQLFSQMSEYSQSTSKPHVLRLFLIDCVRNVSKDLSCVRTTQSIDMGEVVKGSLANHSGIISRCLAKLSFRLASVLLVELNSPENESLELYSQDMTVDTAPLLDDILKLQIAQDSTEDICDNISKRLVAPLLLLVERRSGSFSYALEDNPSSFLGGVVESATITAQGSCLEQIWKHIIELQVVRNNHTATTTLLCIIFQSMNSAAFKFFHARRDCCEIIFGILLQGLLSDAAVVRKRSAYLLQQIASPATQTSHTHHQQESESSGRQKKKGSRGGGSSNAVFESSSQNSWAMLYLNVYNQIDGSNSMHLISQIWPILDQLCMTVASNINLHKASTPRLKDGACADTVLPTITFPWIKSLLHCLLRCQVPVIRRAALYRILTGSLPFPLTMDMIHWFCFELLGKFTDSVTYYSAYFIQGYVEIGCKIAIDAAAENFKAQLLDESSTGVHIVRQNEKDSTLILESIAATKTHILPATYPGVLLPAFLAGLLSACVEKDKLQIANSHDSLLSHFLIRSLVRMICEHDGIASLSAVKWILRAFADENVQKIIPRCLSQTSLTEIKSFIEAKVLCSNGVVKMQILQGILPLLLCGFVTSHRCNSLYMEKSFFDDIGKGGNTLTGASNPIKQLPTSFTEDPTSAQQNDVLRFVRIVINQIGLDILMSDSRNIQIFKTAIVGALASEEDISNASSVSAVNYSSASFLQDSCYFHAIASACFSSDESTLFSLDSEHWLLLLMTELFSTASKLYHSPYADQSMVVNALWYVTGILETACKSSELLLNEIKHRTACEPLDLSNFFLHPRLDLVFRMIPYLSSYLSLTLRTCLQHCNENCVDSSSTGVGRGLSVLTDGKILDAAVVSLGGSLVTTLYLIYLAAYAQRYYWKGQMDPTTSYLKSFLYSLKANSSSVKTNIDDVVKAIEELMLFITTALENQLRLPNAFNSVSSVFFMRTAAKLLPFLQRAIIWAAHIDNLLQVAPANSLHTSNRIGSFYSPVLTLRDAVCSSSLLDSMQKIAIQLLKWRQCDISDYRLVRQVVAGSSTANDGGTSIIGSKPMATLLIWHILESDVYSRHVADCLRFRWSVINEVFLCLMARNVDVSSKSPPILPPNHEVLSAALLKETLNQLLLCPSESLPELFNCCVIAVRSILSVNPDDQDMLHTITQLLAAAWAATLGNNTQIVMKSLAGFVNLVFDSFILGHPQLSALSKEYFHLISELGMQHRPHIMVILISKLSAVWMAQPQLSIPFFEGGEILQLLLYKEPKLDDHNTANTACDTRFGDSSNSSVLSCRLLTLTFLERFCREDCSEEALDALRPHIQGLMRDLVNLNLEKVLPNIRLCPDFRQPIVYVKQEMVTAAMIGTELFGRKLRSWQTLCVLASCGRPHADIISSELVSELAPKFILVLGHNCCNAVRVPLEAWGAMVTWKFPDIMIPILLEQLHEFNHSQQKLASIFIILGHIVLNSGSVYREKPLVEESVTALNSSSWRRITNSVQWLADLIAAILPWLACASGLPRSIAQLVIHAIIPKYLELVELPTTSQLQENTIDQVTDEDSPGELIEHMQPNLHEEENDSDIPRLVCNREPEPPHLHTSPYFAIAGIKQIHRYLDTNKDSVKVMTRQRQFYQEYNIFERSSVRGLQQLVADQAGEFVSDHLLTVLTNMLRANAELEEATERAENISATSATDDRGCQLSPAQSPSTAALQTKIIPFDELQLAVDELALSRRRNSAGRKRQNIIVCASLIDKITNLAGIARTCEIFAVEELILPAMSVIRTDEFKGIAVSCEDWLPMKAIPEPELAEYFRTMKHKCGYRIIAIEQTDKSVSLADLRFPTSKLTSTTGTATENDLGELDKCILLLGKEKEGVPVSLLQEVDICVEIPQFGVIRSLNVHVSAALAIWEATKQNFAFRNQNSNI